MKYFITILLCFLFSENYVVAAGTASGKINSITIKETGYILISLESPHSNPMACEQNKMIAIANNHVAKNEILSVVLSAHATRKLAAFWITGCYEYYGTSFPIGTTATIHQS